MSVVNDLDKLKPLLEPEADVATLTLDLMEKYAAVSAAISLKRIADNLDALTYFSIDGRAFLKTTS